MTARTEEPLARAALDAWERSRRSERPRVLVTLSGAPVELIRALDLEPDFPEADALARAARGASLPSLLRAEEQGYATESCSAVKSDLGLPAHEEPALVVGAHAGCGVYVKWFEHRARASGAPLHVIDVPPRRGPDDADDRRYVSRQLRELVPVLEQVAEKRLDPDRLRAVMAAGRRADEAWRATFALLARRPAPFDAALDAMPFLVLGTCLRGTEESALLLERAARELARAAPPAERFRIAFEGQPPLARTDELRALLDRWGARCVAATGPCVGGTHEVLAPHARDPFDELAARLVATSWLGLSLHDRARALAGTARARGVDGVVVHAVKSCRVASAGLGDVREHLAAELGVPVLLLESDHVDPRFFTSASVRTRVDAFFELLEHRRRIG